MEICSHNVILLLTPNKNRLSEMRKRKAIFNTIWTIPRLATSTKFSWTCHAISQEDGTDRIKLRHKTALHARNKGWNWDFTK